MKNALLSILYTIITKGYTFVLNYIAITYLVLKQYGEFSLFLSTINSMVVIASLGLLYSGNVVVSKWMEKNSKFVLEYFIFSFFLISLISCLLAIIAYLLTGYYIESFICILVFGLTVLMESFFFGLNKFNRLVNFGIFNAIFSVILVFILTKYYGLIGAVWGFTFSKLVLLILQAREFNKFFKISYSSFKITKVKSIITYFVKHNLPLLLSALISTPVLTLAMYILSYYKGHEELAIYSWCYQIYLLGMFVPASLGNYYLSILNKQSRDKKNLLMRKINFFNVSVTIVTILLMFLSMSLLLKLGNLESNLLAKKTFYYFLIAMFFYSFNLSFMSFWSSIGKASLHLNVQFIWALVLILTTLLCVDIMGSRALPIAMALAYFIQGIYQQYKFNEIIKVN